MSSWGPSLLSRLTFPITDDIKGNLRLDYRARRGFAGGFESEVKYGKAKSSFAKLRTYFVRDENPFVNRTSLPRGAFEGPLPPLARKPDELRRRLRWLRHDHKAKRRPRPSGLLPG